MCAPHSKRVANAPDTCTAALLVIGRRALPGALASAALPRTRDLGLRRQTARRSGPRAYRRSTALRHTGRARTARCQPSLEQRSELCPHLPEMWRSSHSSGMPTRTFACSPHAAARSTTRAWGGRVRAVRAGRRIYILHADDAVMVGLGLGLGLGL